MLTELLIGRTLSYPSGSAKIKIDIFNERIKLINFDGKAEEMLYELQKLTRSYDVGKIICVTTKSQVKILQSVGFVEEAEIDGFYKGETGYYLSKFLLDHRKISNKVIEENKVINKAIEYQGINLCCKISKEFLLRDACPEDADAMAKIYGEVFQTYPTPMNDSEYIKQAMQDNIIFKVVTHNGEIISAASADLDVENLNAEVTDCATLPDYRGSGLMAKLIEELEKELRKRNFLMAYTIARATSYGINIVFAKLNYKYTGRLINNCHICGQFEDMNIWVKGL